MISFVPYGDAAILINFRQELNEALNNQLHAYNKIVRNSEIPGLLQTIPSYSSLAVLFDPSIIGHQELTRILQSKFQSNVLSETSENHWCIPVCYDAEFGPDLSELSVKFNLSNKEIVSLHCAKQYHVFMLGFLPGFVYLGSLDSRLKCQRKDKPRLQVPRGSVGLAGLQTGIYPSISPGGWQIIGRTAFPVFAPWLNDPFPIKAGDTISFVSCTMTEFMKIETDVKNQAIQLESFHG